MDPEVKPGTLLTGFQILCSPLPELLSRTGFQTSSTAYHRMYYNGPLALWPIESEAREIVSRKNLNTDHLSASVRDVSKHPCFIDCEHALCDDELSACNDSVDDPGDGDSDDSTSDDDSDDDHDDSAHVPKASTARIPALNVRNTWSSRLGTNDLKKPSGLMDRFKAITAPSPGADRSDPVAPLTV
ncbi:hypothetical protein UA08_07890 [Talaromyces atroroseus]|uniref:Uncharacterized protein n=1 Tax=Talaromyces atroroseus TaxID=1441469 RepID=A0A225ADB1_TALAT|nr:hypothetical protein UA08_07890 [Talaromyces atroroseus]OKL56933.1 hypothetical protein UA08_07890 [Talaromyces atroroseus]